jgi:ABC-type multidrug transport system ATPase subunit
MGASSTPRDRGVRAGEVIRDEPRRLRRRPRGTARVGLRDLGPNGAGKTTTIRILATLVRPDAGEARVLGHDVVRDADAVRGAISLTGQLASVDESLTGEENLILLGRLLGFSHKRAKARAAELLEAFGLVEAADRLVKGYSGGMRRRLDSRRASSSPRS